MIYVGPGKNNIKLVSLSKSQGHFRKYKYIDIVCVLLQRKCIRMNLKINVHTNWQICSNYWALINPLTPTTHNP